MVFFSKTNVLQMQLYGCDFFRLKLLRKSPLPINSMFFCILSPFFTLPVMLYHVMLWFPMRRLCITAQKTRILNKIESGNGECTNINETTTRPKRIKQHKAYNGSSIQREHSILWVYWLSENERNTKFRNICIRIKPWCHRNAFIYTSHLVLTLEKIRVDWDLTFTTKDMFSNTHWNFFCEAPF